MHGFLNLNKPVGATSRQVVNRIQRLTGITRVGHAGTLDPLATGVLVVGVGAATRLIEYVQRMPKSYRGTFLLGRHSPTEDLEGDVTLLHDPPVPTLDEVTAAAAKFVGRIQQRPPAYSALKIPGRPAYRSGPSRPSGRTGSREVTIQRLAVVAYEYPGIGPGNRVQRRDVHPLAGPRPGRIAGHRGRHVGPGADGRRRIYDRPGGRSASTFRRSCAALLQPLVAAVAMLPKIVLSPDEAVRIGHGLTIRAEIGGATAGLSSSAEPVKNTAGQASSGTEPAAHPEEIAAVDESGRLVAIIGPAGGGLLRPLRTFPPE